MRTSVRKRVQFAVTILLCAVLLGLIGCNRGGDPIEMLSGALDAEMTLDMEGISYRVAVHLGAASDSSVRDKEVIFLSPDSLSGMKVCETADGITVTQNGITTVQNERSRALLLAASLLSPGDVVRTETESEGKKVYTVYHLSDGRALYYDDDKGSLCRVEGDGYRATIERIEGK